MRTPASINAIRFRTRRHIHRDAVALLDAARAECRSYALDFM
jgi:hypothetical protein